jgi:dTDP-4-amino-4,6-dideoxygalactose transaminase
VKIQRTLPPAAAPISSMDLMYGFHGIVKKESIAQLEEEIKEYFGTKYAFFLSSGKAALYLILMGLKRMNGKNKVIIPAYTCYSVPSAIRMAGLDIVLCDVRPDTLDFDYSELMNLVDDDTLCVVPTHLFGVPSDIEKIRVMCKSKGIYIVEDAAQAMGAICGNKKLGTLGDVAFFSLGRGKNINCGSGGLIITSAGDIAESIRGYHADVKQVPIIEYVKNVFEVLFQMFFIHPYLYWFPKHLPFLRIGETRFHSSFPVYKLTGFQAGLLHDWREKLEIYNRDRSITGNFYLQNLDVSNRMPIYANGVFYLRFPIYMKSKREKKELCKMGNLHGISPMYPDSINNVQEIKEKFSNMHYANAKKIAETLVALPTHILLNEKDKIAIKEYVNKFQDH